MRLAILTLSAVSVLMTAACERGAESGATVYELRNGLWFDGGGFAARTVYVSDGVIQAEPRHAADSVLDLQGGFVIPPFADAHTHWVEPALVATYVARHLLDGIFYVRDLNNAESSRPRLDSLTDTPRSVDFVTANQGFTGPGGHPLEVIDQLVAVGAVPKPETRDALEDFVFVVESEADVDRVWPRFVAGHPDLVKVYLIFSDEYQERRGDDRVGPERGIDPALVPGIVRRAKAAGLRVSAHVATAADFRNAIAAGVDEIAHLPFDHPDLGPSVSLIDETDARDAKARGVTVTTTIGWLGPRARRDSSAAARALAEVVVPNLRVLKAAGVPILVGSDQFRGTAIGEAEWLLRTGVFTPLELLRTWVETTSRAIFPDRRIGRFEDGFEASLLVLDGDPTADFANIGRIRLRMKQGVLLQVDSAAAQF